MIIAAADLHLVAATNDLLNTFLVDFESLAVVQIGMVDPALRVAREHLTEAGSQLDELEAEQL